MYFLGILGFLSCVNIRTSFDISLFIVEAAGRLAGLFDLLDGRLSIIIGFNFGALSAVSGGFVDSFYL